MKKVLFSILLIAQGLLVYAQDGTIRGTVIEDATGEPLIGVTVVIAGTTNGAITDFDGNFFIKAQPGTYTIQVSYVSFSTISIDDVLVESGNATYIGSIRMKEDTEELEEVVVTAEIIRTTEAALLTVKRKSANVIDGISSEQFRNIGDSDAAGAVRRVPGVSIQGGQYVFVRGLGDRYTKTVLNGLEIPGLDPDRNSLQIDIFPTNLIDNIIVYKTFTPDLSADFVGGTVDIETKDFPEEKYGKASVSFEVNPSMHFRDDFIDYENSSNDWLGFDTGGRDLPIDGRDVDVPEITSGDPFVTEATESFDPILGTKQTSNLANLSIGLAQGNQFEKDNYTWGYNAAMNYRNRTQFFENAVDNFFVKPPNQDETVLIRDTELEGPLGTRDVQASGLLGISFKKGNSKFSLQGLHIQNGTSRAAKRFRTRSNENTNLSIIDNLEYTERFLSNILGTGEHYFDDNSFDIKWRLGITKSVINDQDVRITPFTLSQTNPDDLTLASIQPSEGGEPNRIWRLLDEFNYTGRVDFTKELNINGRKSKLKGGLSGTLKSREYEIQNFIIAIQREEQLGINGDPNKLLLPQNILQFDNPGGGGTSITDAFNESLAYEGDITVFGAYVMGELQLTNKLKSILGVRVEKYDQFYTGINQSAAVDPTSPLAIVFEDENVLDELDFFPSVNFVYELIEDRSNLRASFSRTVARPSFKEKSFAEIADVLTGLTFLGNIDLVQTDINNYDLRWELFFPGGQLISIGGFYKTFENPIELVRQPGIPTDVQPANVGDAQIYGIEFEVRRNLSFITPALDKFSFATNVTVTQSEVKANEAEILGNQGAIRTGETVRTERDFVGQPPFIVNANLTYQDFETGWNATLSYNVQGRTLNVVGLNDAPDTYTVPFNSLNFNIAKAFGVDQRNELSLRVTNILNDVRELEFESFRSPNFIARSREPGTAFRIKYTRSF